LKRKKIGVEIAAGDFIAFLDDDSRPFEDYFEKMCCAFEDKLIMGLCGNVINYPYRGKVVQYFYYLFNVGFFRGSRIGVYGSNSSAGKLIRTHQLSGGCSIWRKEVFDEVKFDLENYLHYFEDIDFSYRVYKKFPGSLYINLDSKIVDLNESAGLKNYRGIFEIKLFESAKIYVKYRSNNDIHSFHYVLYVLGRCLESMACGVREKSLNPVLGFLLGCYRATNYILKNRC